LALAASVSPAAAQVAARRSPDLADVPRFIIDRTNDFRRAEGRRPTGPDAMLGAAARGLRAAINPATQSAYAARMAALDVRLG